MSNFNSLNYIGHYSHREPFRLITSAPQGQWPSMVEKLNITNAWRLSRFSDPSLQQRAEVEA